MELKHHFDEIVVEKRRVKNTWNERLKAALAGVSE